MKWDDLRKEEFQLGNKTTFVDKEKAGKRYCPSHNIKMSDMDAVALDEIRSMAKLVVKNEEKAKAKFLARKAKHHEEQYDVDTKKLTAGKFRLQKLDTLIQNIYEDKDLVKASEDVAIKLIAKYEAEQKKLSEEVADMKKSFPRSGKTRKI